VLQREAICTRYARRQIETSKHTIVLQCVTVCCSVSQSVTVCVCCRVLQCITVCCSVLQSVTGCCRVFQCFTVWCHELNHELTVSCIHDKHLTKQRQTLHHARRITCDMTHFNAAQQTPIRHVTNQTNLSCIYGEYVTKQQHTLYNARRVYTWHDAFKCEMTHSHMKRHELYPCES